MGVGAGATNTVDFRQSLQVAVEDAEAEIRLEISDQEYLHRQLWFLEKGRSLLDFKFRETSSIGVKLKRPSDALVEQILSSSQVQGVVGDVAKINLGLGILGKFGSTSTLSRERSEGFSIHEGDVIVKRIPAGKETSDNGLLAHENSLVIEHQESLYMRKGEEVPTCTESVSPSSHVSQSEYNENNAMSHGSMVLAVKDYVSLHGDKQSKNSIVDSKLKDTIAVANQSDCSLSNLNAANFSSDMMVRKESKKINLIVDAGASIETNLNIKTSSTCNLAKVHSQKVDIDHQLEECKRVCIEEIPAMAAKKAQQHIILEKAKFVKNFQVHIAKWASRKAMPKSSKEKSHWDFVLEEFAWLANDFMQERVWKISAAARFCQQACCMYNSHFKAVSSDQERETSSFDTVKVLPKIYSNGTSLSSKSYQDRLYNPDINVSVPVDVDSSTYKEEHLVALAKGDARASLLNELDLTDFETKPLIGQSLARIGFEAEDDALEIQDVTSSLDSSGGPQVAFAKRKRKQILNRSSEVNPNVGLYVPNLNPYTIIPSIHAFVKRPLGNRDDANCVNVDSFPTKRLRTAAVAARQHSSGTAGPIFNKLGVTGPNKIIIGAVELQQKGLLGLSEVSVPERNMKSESSPQNSTQAVTSDDICSSPVPKRIKNTKFHSVALPSTTDGAVHASYLGRQKSDHPQQTASNMSSSDAGFVVGEHLLKKVKLSKQIPEEQFDCECTPNQAEITKASQKVSNLSSPLKVFRQISGRDRLKENKLGKGYFLHPPASQPGLSIPWSIIEDQAILALVHDLGRNWELVSDVLSSSSQVKGICRKPLDCEARHQVLMECLSIDEVDSSADMKTHAHSSSFPLNFKGSIQMLLQRFQGPMEEDTLKVHFEQILRIVHQDLHKKNQIKNKSENQQEIFPVHISHMSALSQLSPNSLPGDALTPLDLCDRTSQNREMNTNAFLAQPTHLSGMEFSGVFSAGSWLQPSSAGVPLLPSLQGDPAPSLSSATLNAARDAQWMAASMRTLSAEEQRLRYARLATGRGLLEGPSSRSTPLTNLSLATDCSLPVLSLTSNGSLIGGLSRSTSLPSVGLQTMLAFGVSGMVPAGINGMLPSTGVVVTNTSTLSARSPINLVRSSNDAIQTMQTGQGTEDQRLMLIQELQHHASQGNTHAAAALSSLPSTMVSSPKHALAIQQQNSHQLQQHPPNEAYFAALQLAKERRLQQEHERLQQQQQQYQKRILQQQQLQQNSSIQPQAHSLTYRQHMEAQQNLQSQLQLQHHADLTAPNVGSLEEQSATPLVPPTLQTSQPQLSATTAQLPSLGPSVQDSSPHVLDQMQLHSHSNLQPRPSSGGVEGPGRVVMAILPVVSSQPAQPK